MNAFFTTIYELGSVFYLGDFSDYLHRNDLYMPVGFVMVISSLVGMLIYYYVLNHPRYDKWYHWFGCVVVVGIINAVSAYWVVLSKLEIVFAREDEEVPFSTEFFSYSIVDFLWTLIFCFVFSLLVKWGSSNCRKTPF
jgi:hypothetical protein